MLFAVEGGGFFSSSASGYSKGLTLLLLGQKSEEKPMRVTPWNQYQLVDQETEPDLQLASGKKRLVRGCASFKCFGRAPDGLESPSHLKVGPAQNEEVLPEPPHIDESKDQKQLSNTVEVGDINRKIINLKSSLKKTTNSVPAAATDSGGKGNNSEHEEFCGRENDEHEAFYGREHDVTCQTERRKVQWTDTTGGELFQIREFEMSDESDDEFHHGNDKTCSCTIM